MIVKNPIAAIIEGITKGSVRRVLIRDSNRHLYLPNIHDMGIPIISVMIVEDNA